MIKKILYSIGGFFVFLMFLVGITPEQEVAQQKKYNSVAVKKEVVTATDPTPVPTEQNEANLVDVKIPVEDKPEITTTETPQIKSDSQYEYYLVSKVVDGDTIKIDMNGTIETLRLIGLDTPETVDPRKPVQCFGKEASDKATELLLTKKIRIEKDSSQGERDKYNRLLAYVYIGDIMYNKHMIENGYAHEYTYKVPYNYQSEFKTAQKHAMDNSLGLWSSNTCNGETNQINPVTTQTEEATPTPQLEPTIQSSEKFYTSSFHSSKYYYPEYCDGWKGLSERYLKSFNSLDELLAKYTRTKSPQCK